MTVPRTASAMQQLIAADGHALHSVDDELTEWDHYCNLALQVLHNLQHQHRWTQLKLHTHSPIPPYQRMTRPLLSGMPPRRLYVHPDEQIEYLKLEDEQKKWRAAAEPTPPNDSADAVLDSAEEFEGEVDLSPQPVREWVLPTHIAEKWSLRKMATIFDAVCSVPPEPDPSDSGLLAENPPSEKSLRSPDKWRETKRLLLATADDDSTVVYYIVHDGIVKPRQN